MSSRKTRNVEYRMTEEDRQRHAIIRREVEDQREELSTEALATKAERLALRDAVAMLKGAREKRGLSLDDVAQRSGLDAGELASLEAADYPNPTLGTLCRIATAIGVELTIDCHDTRAA
jgi:ribosome-binding protein aMBF1 (putative translation factor)